MAIQFIPIKCPDCGAELSIESNREFAFCTYCGAKVIVHNENEHIVKNISETKIIDAARIKEAETAQILKLRELQLREKEQDRKHKSKRNAYVVALIMVAGGALLGFIFPLAFFGVIYGIILAFMTFLKDDVDQNNGQAGRYISPDEVAISNSMVDCIDKGYQAIETIFRSAGFTNIRTIPLGDLSFFTKNKNGLVDSVSINGEENFKAGEIVPKHSVIIISYHSKE